MEEFLLILAILLPAAAALLSLWIPWVNKTRWNRCIYVGAVLVLECIVVALVALNGERTAVLFYMTEQMPIALRSDGTSMVFSLVMALMWMISGFFSFRYMEHEKNEKSYYAFYLLVLSTLMALTLSGTMVTMYLFFEAMTFLSVPMVLHSRSKEAIAAGIKYLIYSVAGPPWGCWASLSSPPTCPPPTLWPAAP